MAYSAFLLYFFLTFIHIPKKVNWEKYIPEGTVEWVHQTAVSKFFDERPVWAKESLTELLLEKGIDFREGMLKRWFPLLCCVVCHQG